MSKQLKAFFMKYLNFSGKIFTVIATSIFLAGIYSPAWADGGTEAQSLELRRIMQELGKNMQVITDAISREDWALVAKIAPQIAEHPEPSAIEKIRILTFMGADMGKFESYDETTHHAARVLEQAAARNNEQGIITAFESLQNSCLACHQDLRQSFVEHFYGQY